MVDMSLNPHIIKEILKSKKFTEKKAERAQTWVQRGIVAVVKKSA
jgi:hypothetical protein